MSLRRREAEWELTERKKNNNCQDGANEAREECSKFFTDLNQQKNKTAKSTYTALRYGR